MALLNEEGLRKKLKSDTPHGVFCIFGEDTYLKDFYLKNKLKSLKSVLKSNLAQWKMINKLGFKSPLKYIILKFRYHIKYAKVGVYNTPQTTQY